DVPRIACAWSDWDLTTQGTMHFFVGPSGSFVACTWNNVNERAAAGSFGSNSFQLLLTPGGQIDFVWGNVAHTAPPLVVGFGRGNGTRDPGSVDLSAVMPLQSGDGAVPLTLGMDARPRIGTSPSFVTTGMAPGTYYGLIALAFASAPGVPLAPLGMPGCFRYIGVPATTSVFRPLIGNAFAVPLAIPNSPSSNGVSLLAQPAALTSSLNAAAVVTSNGLCLHVGLR